MLFSSKLFLGLALPLLANARSLDLGKAQKEHELHPKIRGGFVVELETDAEADSKLGKRGISDRTTGHNRFIDTLSGLGIPAQTRQIYNADIFYGLSIQVDASVADAVSIDSLRELPGVVHVSPILAYQPLDQNHPKRIRNWAEHKRRLEAGGDLEVELSEDELEVEADIALENVELAAELEAQLDGRDLMGSIGGATVTERAPRAYPSIPASEFKQDTFAPHIMTAVDQAHKQGILGEGIRIAVLDTGIDYKHPALGKGFGPGYKVQFGYDLVGDGYSGYNEPVPDDDPMDPCGLHGTHVSGIIGADPNPFNFTGVAPHAILGHYRVFGCEPPTEVQNDVLIKGMVAAYDDGADIITLSIGGVNGWTEDAASRLANRINALGRIVTISAGNNGAEGPFYTSSPAASIRTWSIGSVQTIELPILRHATATPAHDIPYYALFKFPDAASGLPIYATSDDLNDPADACEPLPASTPDLSKYIVVARRGSCLISEKYSILAAAGAQYVILANNGGAPFYEEGVEYGLKAAALTTDEAGIWLRQRAINNQKTTIDFSSDASESVPGPTGGLIDTYSTWGPTFDMLGQPTMSAPGGNILSTFPRRLDGYGIISGTSMACPAVAGAGALYLSAGGDRPTKSVDIRGVFISTSNDIPLSKNDSRPIPVVRQGAGQINVTRALATKTFVYPNQISLNDTAHFRGTPELTITNKNSKAQTYAVSHEPVLTALTFDAGESDYISLAPQYTDNHASVAFTHDSITVPAGGSVTITAKFSPPTANAKRYPLYGGFVVFKSKTETIRVPYQGLQGALYDQQIVDDRTDVLGVQLPLVIEGANTTTGQPQKGPQKYTLKGEDFPTLVVRLNWGTPRMTVDLVKATTDFVPTIDDPWRNNKTEGTPPSPTDTTTYESVAIVGNIPEMSPVYTYRNGVTGNLDYEVTWSGNITVDGKDQPAANGRYRFLLRAHKLNGVGTLERDWESWLSPIINVQRA